MINRLPLHACPASLGDDEVRLACALARRDRRDPPVLSSGHHWAGKQGHTVISVVPAGHRVRRTKEAVCVPGFAVEMCRVKEGLSPLVGCRCHREVLQKLAKSVGAITARACCSLTARRDVQGVCQAKMSAIRSSHLPCSHLI